MPGLTELERNLGLSFRNSELLREALVHSSYLNENPDYRGNHNERLEFLGDAVLGLLTAEELYRAFPNLAEGEMTRARAFLVRRETLAGLARSLRLGEFLLMGRGEEASGGRDKTPNLAGAFEALIAAIYLDQGIEVTQQLVRRLFSGLWQELTTTSIHDYKSRLQEITQARFQQIPSYHLVKEDGPPHDRTFTVEVRLNDTVLGTASGKSKKAAETAAARKALEDLGKHGGG
ncbi:MAG: ribonuclease III [Dehalococcoidales bacterium]|nr:ribonuclease III [Dehalococcoidales bacterium]